MAPFEFIVEGPAVSQQARRRGRWIAKIRQALGYSRPAATMPASGPVMVVLTYFYDDGAPDVDNLAKPSWTP